MSQRVFGARDQTAFGRLTGDVNPIHADAVAARRTQAGEPVVHGMHAVLWMLDALAASGRATRPFASLGVQFRKFVYPGAVNVLHVVRETATSLRAELRSDGVAAIRLDLELGAPPASAAAPAPPAELVRMPAEPLDRGFDELGSLAGRLPRLPADAVAAAFPSAATIVEPSALAALAQLSALVGMVCPGLHSIFGGLRVVAAPETRADELGFRVTAADERVRMVTLAVRGGGIAGEVTAFARQVAAEHDLASVARRVRPGEFAPATALVVGGSRGLGAVTARALAAGGGRVAITYLAGEADAHRVAAEIGAERCRVLRYDARAAAAPQLAALDWDVNELYYFATGQIFRQRTRAWEPERFASFCAVYVNGFMDAYAALRARGGDPAAFYPSSVAVDEAAAELAEYRIAKAAGEMACAEIDRGARRKRVLVTRLPRIGTDQTMTIVPVASADALDVMLPVLREMRALAR